MRVEGGGRRTEGGGRRTEDGGRRAEGGGRGAEDGFLWYVAPGAAKRRLIEHTREITPSWAWAGLRGVLRL